MIWRQMICQEAGIHRVLHKFPLIYCLPVLVCGDMCLQTEYFDIENLGADNLKTKVDCKLILGKCKVKRCVNCCWEQGLGIWRGQYSLFVAHAQWSLLLGIRSPPTSQGYMRSNLNWDAVQSLGSLGSCLPIPQRCLPLLIPLLSYHQPLALQGYVGGWRSPLWQRVFLLGKITISLPVFWFTFCDCISQNIFH